MRTPRQITRREGVCVPVHNPSIFLSLLVNTAASKTCLAPHRPAVAQQAARGEEDSSTQKAGEVGEEVAPNVCQRVGPNVHVAIATAHFKTSFSHAQHGRKKEIRLTFSVIINQLYSLANADAYI